MTFEETTVPGMDTERERAFKTDTGEIVVVRLTRKEHLEREGIALLVQSRLVNEDGETVCVDGVPCVPNKRTATVYANEGKTDIETVMARKTAEAVERTVNHKAAMEAWAKIPPADDE